MSAPKGDTWPTTTSFPQTSTAAGLVDTINIYFLYRDLWKSDSAGEGKNLVHLSPSTGGFANIIWRTVVVTVKLTLISEHTREEEELFRRIRDQQQQLRKEVKSSRRRPSNLVIRVCSEFVLLELGAGGGEKFYINSPLKGKQSVLLCS